ncbi:MAG: hypothetical protein WA361_22060 [Candidatus Acidiferrales bacterium]
MKIPSSEADTLFQKMLQQKWGDGLDGSKTSIHYGCSYTMYGGAADGEIPEIPSFLAADIIPRLERQIQMPINYVQCHNYDPSKTVHPHKDPAGMIVPMLAMGQERTFRVGGTMPKWAYQFPQLRRKIEDHVPEKEILLDHGRILTFNGGKILHSMLPADCDPQFRANGCDTRITLLFRYTTPAMRKFGCNKNLESQQQYQMIREAYRNGTLKLFPETNEQEKA